MNSVQSFRRLRTFHDFEQTVSLDDWFDQTPRRALQPQGQSFQSGLYISPDPCYIIRLRF